MAGIINFAGSYVALSAMRKNESGLNKSSKRLSGGERITGAADGGADYAISEKMRVLIRGLRQSNDNAKTAGNLLATAENALHETADLLKKMQELAVKSANGVYTDADRAIMDAEYQQCKAQIDEIAATANYNGIPLLDGTWGAHRESGVRVDAPDVPAGAVTETVVGGVPEITITADGAFTIPKGFSGDIRVKAANVLLRQETPEQLTNVSIRCDAGTNLLIENLNVQTVNDTGLAGKSIIDFTGTGNTLTLIGTNTLTGEYTSPSPPSSPEVLAASLIHVGVGTELTVQENGSADLYMEKKYHMPDSWDSGGALLGGNAAETCGTIVINSGNIIAKNGYGSNGAAIGTGVGSFDGLDGSIIINGGTIEAVSYTHLCRKQAP